MKDSLKAWGLIFLCVVLLDMAWFSFAMSQLYIPYLGNILSQNIQIIPAILFYGIYAFGILHVIILPAQKMGTSSWHVLRQGSILGLTAYATYDLTNQATLNNWPWIVTLIDLTWGTFLTGLTSFFVYNVLSPKSS